MVKRHVFQIGNPVIRKKTIRVALSSKRLQHLIKNLTDSMRFYALIGMAAPQIGSNSRVFVTEIRRTKTRRQQETDPLRVYSNPCILFSSKQKVSGYEGCGSIAAGQLFGLVRRPKTVIVEAYDDQGKKFRIGAKGLLSRVIQHEMDHLNGVVFLDRVIDTKTLMSREEYLKKTRKLGTS
jgi:peptide deformylase